MSVVHISSTSPPLPLLKCLSNLAYPTGLRGRGGGGARRDTTTDTRSGGEGSPGKQRQAIRSVVGRAPLVGGNRALKQALTDLKPVEGKSSGIGGSTYKRTTYGTTDF